MIDKLHKLDLNLNKLEEFDKNKFSYNDFKFVNKQLNESIVEIMSSIKIDDDITLSSDEQVYLEKILSKIDKLETKILPKANLLNSFAQSIV